MWAKGRSQTAVCVTCVLWIVAVLLGNHGSHADQLPTCQPKDFHYEYTECDSEGGRWRVSVPEPNTCEGGAPNAPVRGQGCAFTCKAGEYLAVQGDQECHPCPNGTYSLGGGVRFEDWRELPPGFSIETEKFSMHGMPGGPLSQGRLESNCTGPGWKPKGHHISSMPGECATKLTYTANLVQAGTVIFSYQYTDDDILFQFVVQNSQCETIESKEGHRWIPTTDEGEWAPFEVPLKSGMNVLYWKTMSVSEDNRIRKPVNIRGVEISGVAYTSKCTDCEGGTYSGRGASTCTPCEPGTYAPRGSGKCKSCRDNEYSERGASKCKSRPACTADDYYEYDSPCDQDGKTQKMYKWIQPQVCLTSLPDSVSLPHKGIIQDCPPCNPGSEPFNKTCQFCKPNHFSDGRGPCEECPASTAPEVGIMYNWWNSLPANSNISATCLSVEDGGCRSKEGWVTELDHIRSAKGHDNGAYLVLSLDIGGFQGSEQNIAGHPSPVAEISFMFQTECSGECSFFFMKQSDGSGTTIINNWSGSQDDEYYSFSILSTEPVSFTWAFQKRSWQDVLDTESEQKAKNDVARIFSLNVTNTIQGGAATCRRCPQGTSLEGCIPCPDGHYIESDTTTCQPCPEATIIQGSNPWGIESCMKCGEGLRAENHARCVTDCVYKSPEGRMFDFTDLAASTQSVQGSRLFTSSGTQYSHMFNISLCGGQRDFPLVTCYDNISSVGALQLEETIKSVVCRMTIIPPRPGEKDEIMAAQPASLGDVLVNITTNGSSLNIDEMMETEGFDQEGSEYDVHFTYVSNYPTPACKDGRTMIITMRCEPSQKGNGTIIIPPKCSDGTCDGCKFHFLWRTEKACPSCKHQEYKVVKGECINGEQEIHYIPPPYCAMKEKGDSPTVKQACSILPFWLQIAIGVCIGFGFLLCVMLIYCWKKNKKKEKSTDCDSA